MSFRDRNNEDDYEGRGFSIPMPEEMVTLDLNILRNEPSLPAAIRLMATNFGKGYFSVGSFLKNFSDTDLEWVMDTSLAFADLILDVSFGKKSIGKNLPMTGDSSFFVMVCHLMALGEGLPVSLKVKDVGKIAKALTALIKLEQISRKDNSLKLNYRVLTLDPSFSYPKKADPISPYANDVWFFKYENPEEPNLERAFSEANSIFLKGEVPDLLGILQSILFRDKADPKPFPKIEKKQLTFKTPSLTQKTEEEKRDILKPDVPSENTEKKPGTKRKLDW